MKSTFFLLTLTLVLLSCEPPTGMEKRKEKKQLPNKEDEKVVIDWQVDPVILEDLTDTIDNNFLVHHNGFHLTPDSNKFTGIGIEYYPEEAIDKQIYLAVNYKNGVIQKTANFDKKGKRILVQEYYRGKPKSLHSNCLCSELSDTTYKKWNLKLRYDFPFTGECIAYHYKSTQPSRKETYENGLLNGFSYTYNKNGVILGRTKYKNNVVLENQTFNEEGLLIEKVLYKNGNPIKKIVY